MLPVHLKLFQKEQFKKQWMQLVIQQAVKLLIELRNSQKHHHVII